MRNLKFFGFALMVVGLFLLSNTTNAQQAQNRQVPAKITTAKQNTQKLNAKLAQKAKTQQNADVKKPEIKQNGKYPKDYFRNQGSELQFSKTVTRNRQVKNVKTIQERVQNAGKLKTNKQRPNGKAKSKFANRVKNVKLKDATK